MKKKLRLRTYVIPTMIIMVSILVALGGVLLTNSLNIASDMMDQNLTYVSSSIWLNNSIPVVSEEEDEIIKRPYSEEDVKIVKSFYDYKAEEGSQKNSIIYYEDTYIQNTGVDYAKETSFPVLAILKGTVISVTEDDIVGITVKVKHSNEIISIYQSLSSSGVKVDDEVLQGQQLGMAGTNSINTGMGNHLHFELYVGNKLVNPENYFDKKMGEL